MRRALIVATLTLLLLAVTGITLAQENTTGPESSTMIESTVQNATTAIVEPTSTTVWETTDTSDEESIQGNEPAAEIVKEDSTQPETNDLEVAEKATGDTEEYSDKPEGIGKAKGVGGKPEGRGKAKGDEGEANGGGGQQKVILCHKNRKSLTIAAPAQDAHLRHGDTLGACQSAGVKPGPSEETPRPGVGQKGHGGGGNGQRKVTLCHKGKKTLTVGKPAQSAHLRHGDTEGLCA